MQRTGSCGAGLAALVAVLLPLACGTGSAGRPRAVPTTRATPPTTLSWSEYEAHPPPTPSGYVGMVDRNNGNNFVGYATQADVGGRLSQPFPVYDRDLRTVVGHMYPDKGFVPIGTDPAAVSSVSTTTTGH